MRYLLAPGNNSLSHLVKTIAIRDGLLKQGHDILIAVSRRRAAFLESLDIPYAILPDIQETDGSGFPSVEWFRRPRTIAEVIEAERQLINEFRPDRVLGVFRFTIKAASHLAGAPYDSLTCGCMFPGSTEALGFARDERGKAAQREIISGFFRYGGLRISQALTSFGLPGIDDCRRMLVGERTFLWDFPEFMPLENSNGVLHVGPIFWNKWPHTSGEEDAPDTAGRPLAVVSFGTCSTGRVKGVERLISLLGGLGYHVLFTGSGSLEVGARLAAERWLTICEFAPLDRILPRAKLLVSHGGQMSIFEAIAHQVPIAVIPFQPEQAHNGVCLENMGCGLRLVPGQQFIGDSTVYMDALTQKRDSDIVDAIASLSDPRYALNLRKARQQMSRYRGVMEMVSLMEQANE
ncbi:MAG: glycosyl transferase [Nitrospirota bacterium]|nr:glycosyl transferase [Nitrospirota bacterium]